MAVFGIILIITACGSTKINNNDLAITTPINTVIDLTSIIDDKAPVTIDPGRFTQDEVIYRMPRIIQGSYEVSDIGNYIENFKAYDYEGNELKSEKIDTNSWVIYEAKKLDKLNYFVNDTYDIEGKNYYG